MDKITITNKNYKEIIKKTARLIKSGKIVIFPTDTVYGFLCDAKNKKAVERIFFIKKRSKKKPVSLFVKDIKAVKRIVFLAKSQEKILKKYWPGKTTFILKRRINKTLYGIGKDTVAIRIPKYKFLNALMDKIKNPLIQTSANISGKPPITDINEAVLQFSNKKNKPDFIIDGGVLKGKPSKIIDLTVFPYKILRS